MSLPEFHAILLWRLQRPDILPAWLGLPHCADVPASSCLQAQPAAARTLLCALHHWPLTACPRASLLLEKTEAPWDPLPK